MVEGEGEDGDADGDGGAAAVVGAELAEDASLARLAPDEHAEAIAATTPPRNERRGSDVMTSWTVRSTSVSGQSGVEELHVESIPIYDDTVPISCTIDRTDIPERIALIERLRAHLVAIDRTEHGMLLRFPYQRDVADDVRRFTVDEKRCCSFWGFDVTTTDDKIALRWDAPPAAGDLVAQLVAYFEGNGALTAIEGLL